VWNGWQGKIYSRIGKAGRVAKSRYKRMGKEGSVLYFEKILMKFYKGAEREIFITHWFGIINTEVCNHSHKKKAGSIVGARRNVSIIIQSCVSRTTVLI